MRESRGAWYLLTGMVFGLLLGLAYAWLINPVQYIDTEPASLRLEFKDHYRSLIALSYQADGDVGRAASRLALLHDESPSYQLGAQAQRVLAQSGSEQEARALAELAAALNQEQLPLPTATTANAGEKPTTVGESGQPIIPSATLDESQAIQTPTPLPTATPTLRPTFTPRPSFTPQPTLGAPFALKNRQDFCNPDVPPGLLQIDVQDGSGKPIAGVRVDITWEGGADFFFTGLYPQVSPGYADFTLTAEVVYSVRVGEGGEVVSDLRAGECKTESGSLYLGGVKLTFAQP